METPEATATAAAEPTYECSGCDTAGNVYESNADMWATELHGAEDPQAAPTWYEKSSSYWGKQSATVRGMLGGLDELHDRDITASARFLQNLERSHGLLMDGNCALDVGAGIGRITRDLLLPRFKVVDMLEQSQAYLDESAQYIANSPANLQSAPLGVVGNRFACGMQEFRLSAAVQSRYHLVWIQWCIIYLTDDDLVSFLRVCLSCLADGGILCIKDNIAPRGKVGFVLDKEDSSVMRGDSYMKNLFTRSGARVISQSTQRDFPSNMFPVKTWALVRTHVPQPSTGAPRGRTGRQ